MIDKYKEIRDSIKEFMDLLDSLGYELNEDGDIVYKDTKKLVMDFRGEDNE